MSDLLDLDAIRAHAAHADHATVTALADENERLRQLLAQAKPFLLHNGLTLRLGAMGIKADEEYAQIAAREIERFSEYAVEGADGEYKAVRSTEHHDKPVNDGLFRRIVQRTHFIRVRP